MIKLTISIFILVLTCFTFEIKAQDFLEVKYSLNDINKQRENFKKEKVKSVTFTINNSEKIYKIDKDGKFISENGNSDSPYEIIYEYSENNLTGFIGPFAHELFKYDIYGNVIEVSNEGFTNIFNYDDNFRRIHEEILSEEGEDCPFENIIYDGNKIIEIVGFSCCMGFHDRTLFEYSEVGNLIKINTYTSRCDSDEEVVSAFEEYFYNTNSNLPYKMKSWREGQKVSEINFEYEYYD